MDISPQQKEILRMYVNEFLTARQIAIRRQTSIQAVNKTLAKLRKKGMVVGGVQKTTPSQQPPPQKIRLHGLHFLIKILWASDAYLKRIGRYNIKNLPDATVKLWKHEIEVYVHKDFYANDINKATALSFLWLNHSIPILENDLKCVLIKPRSQNIKLVSGHYAETNNELSEEYLMNGDYLHIYTQDDGKLWFLIDFSKKTFEAEAVHPETAKPDMTKVINYFNDLRDKEHYRPSELKGMFDKVMEVQNQYATLIQRHLIVQEETLKALKGINKSMKEKQSKIGDFK